MRFRSVVKSWKSLIDSSRFVSDYNLRQNQPHIFIVYDVSGYIGMRYVSIVDDDNFPNNMIDLSATLTDPAKQSTRLTLAGSSQGLLCFILSKKDKKGLGKKEKKGLLRMYDSDAIIWNPWIRKSATVNLPNIDYRKYTSVVGFGVCPKTSDPKLVHFTFSSIFSKNKSCKVEVYSLSSGFWRSRSSSKINNLLCGSFILSSASECVDGFIYWCASNKYDKDNNQSWVIISFDLTNEEFGVIYLPDNLARYRILDLSKYRESLVLFPNDYIHAKHVYDVWMMEGGVTKSFKKLFTIKSTNDDCMKPKAISYNGKAVLEIEERYGRKYEASVKTYEPSSNRFKWTTITGTYGSIYMSSYMETMLLHDLLTV